MTAAPSPAWSGFHPNGKDPSAPRLPQATRDLARHYLSGAVGRSLKTVAELNADADPLRRMAIDPDAYLTLPTPARLYALAVREIADKAPLRRLPGEKLAGAATLRDALRHLVPVLGDRSVSHTTLGFEHALTVGYDGLRREISERLARGGLDPEGIDLLHAMLDVIDSAGRWQRRYREELARDGKAELAALLATAAQRPPESFREAVQALWLFWDFQRLCGNWSGLGRVDKMLGPYLERDLEIGAVTLDEARDLLAHFWIKGCEWVTGDLVNGGDAQFYQNVVLAGVDENGREVANEVTDLVLDVVEELHISDFPVAVRLSAKTPERLLRRVAAIQRLGGGTVAVYNEDRIIPMMTAFGYPEAEARDFANDGCWELIVPGKTAFAYQPFDALLLLQQTLGLGPGADAGPPPAFASFEELYADFRRRLARQLTELVNRTAFERLRPTVLVDLLVEGCVERGRSYYDLGPRYTVLSPHPGGLPDVVNSLLALDRLVYRERKYTLPELAAILRDDWNGHEAARRAQREHGDFFGNGSAAATDMARRVFDDFTGLLAGVRQRFGILRPAGASTFGREATDYLAARAATAAGSRRGDILALNFSPTPGTDRQGPTAVVQAHCAVDLGRLPCGTALELKFAPAAVAGPEGLAALAGLMRSFVALGGIFLQVDVVDGELLRHAQEHPEDHPNLAVRISGWSARFATLERHWQELVIRRTEQSR